MAERCGYRSRGFTIIELVVAMSIIGIIAGIGVLQHRESRARQNLEQAAWELVSDIRWMQQLSVNDTGTRLKEPPVYRFKVQILAATAKEPARYAVLDAEPGGAGVMKERKFSAFGNVQAEIVRPGGASADITFYAYDLDRKRADGALENGPFQIRLSSTDTAAVRFVNVDSRVGRVWMNSDGAQPL